MLAFVGSQYRLDIADKEYFIDLLLYHRQLKCLVAIELKIGEFIPEYIGKMQFYLSALDELIKLPDENPSIGIVLCKSKNRIIVEYALKVAEKPIGFQLTLPLKNFPKLLRTSFPLLNRLRY